MYSLGDTGMARREPKNNMQRGLHNGIMIERFKSHRTPISFTPTSRVRGGAMTGKLCNETTKCVNGP